MTITLSQQQSFCLALDFAGTIQHAAVVLRLVRAGIVPPGPRTDFDQVKASIVSLRMGHDRQSFLRFLRYHLRKMKTLPR